MGLITGERVETDCVDAAEDALLDRGIRFLQRADEFFDLFAFGCVFETPCCGKFREVAEARMSYWNYLMDNYIK